MKYFKSHDNEPAGSPYPTIYFIEVDDMRCERRKLVIHLDGRTAFADEHEWHGTEPSEGRFPENMLANNIPRHMAYEIDAAEFERMWERRREPFIAPEPFFGPP